MNEKKKRDVPIGMLGWFERILCSFRAKESTVSSELPVTRILNFFSLTVSRRTRAISASSRTQLFPLPAPPLIAMAKALPRCNASRVLLKILSMASYWDASNDRVIC